jgi:site-specific DNA recombinase
MAAYTRVSTAEQAQSGLGLEAQARAIRLYADLYTTTLAEEVVVDDGFSAKDLNRPGMKMLLGRLDRGEISGVIVSKLDRLTRSVRDVVDLVERYFMDGRFRLVSVSEQIDTSTASGRLVLNVLASVGQWEREAIGERTKAALRSKMDRGERAGEVPFGFEIDPEDPTAQKIRKHAGEQAVIKAAQKMRKHGLSTYKIADDLTRMFPNAARGDRFYQPFVWKLLQSGDE